MSSLACSAGGWLPALAGAHTDRVRAEIGGYARDEIAVLRMTGVIE